MYTLCLNTAIQFIGYNMQESTCTWKYILVILSINWPQCTSSLTIILVHFRVKEYNQAFGSRPKIPRTPDVSSLGKGSQPQDSPSQGKTSQQSQGKQSSQSQGRASQHSQGKLSQSKVPRTPDSSKRPTSRGSISGLPPPQPQYSESGPRPSSAGKSSGQ